MDLNHHSNIVTVLNQLYDSALWLTLKSISDMHQRDFNAEALDGAGCVRRRADLQDEQGEEVQVGCPLELLKHIQRDESDGVVFVRLDCVPLRTEARKPGLETARRTKETSLFQRLKTRDVSF